MRAHGTACALLALALAAGPAAGQSPRPAVAPSAAAARLMAEAIAPAAGADASPGFASLAADGSLAMLSSGGGRGPLAPLVGGAAGDRARAFLGAERGAFGLGANADFVAARTRESRGRTTVRLRQVVDGLPVVGGDAIVQMDAAGRVECVIQKGAREAQLAGLPGEGGDLLAAVAEAAARADARERFPAADVRVVRSTLSLFVPELLEAQGPAARVWDVETRGSLPMTSERLLVDARSGRVLWRSPLDAEALSRTMWDANGGRDRPFTQVRTEGGPATGIADADASYDFLGDGYNFYANRFGRDGYNGSGGGIRGVVRYCGFPGNGGLSCNNASWTGTDTMYVGPGWATDDIIVHEFSHGVTRYESQLGTQNTPGAINESMSDIFGEFADRTNAAGNDSPGMRWRLGEDLAGGAIRNMAHPDSLGHPDRLGSPLYIQPVANPNTANDNGGVHSNCGINNKLCYLLTDGDSFNGQVVNGMGLAAVADLYYEANVNLLTSTSGWSDLYNALRQAAINLGWSLADQNNVVRGCIAVEIAGSSVVYVNAASPCPELGIAVCAFPVAGPARSLASGMSLAKTGDTIQMSFGTYHEGLTSFGNGKLVTIQSDGTPVTIVP